MKQKIENDAVAWARTLAQNQGRNADWAEKAVRESATLSDKEALEAHVVDFIATDIPELLDKASQKLQRPAIKEASIEVFEMSNKQKLMQGLSNPNLLYLLLLIGILGLFIEFQFPGMILPGLLGVLSLAIVFGVQLLPLNWFGVLLILGAVALLIAEMFIASFGLLSVGAFVLFVLGSYLLFEVEGSVFYVDPIMIWSVAVTLILIFVAFGYFIIRAKSQGATSGSEALVGQTAKVFETIAPGQPGSIYIQGSYWAASANEEIEEGALVVIERMESAQAVVKRV
ncbi:MAG: hypothetical protein JKY15_01590 [Deltaproteobacteria bacterium]|nr:hypothetical protein [Deltaproteobacteria bacterium]